MSCAPLNLAWTNLKMGWVIRNRHKSHFTERRAAILIKENVVRLNVQYFTYWDPVICSILRCGFYLFRNLVWKIYSLRVTRRKNVRQMLHQIFKQYVNQNNLLPVWPEQALLLQILIEIHFIKIYHKYWEGTFRVSNNF